MQLARALPLIAFSVFIYILLAFSKVDLQAVRFTIALPSQAKWEIRIEDLLLLVALGLFCIEIIKSSFSGAASMVDHVLSLGLCVVCLLMFLLVEKCGTSSFFFLMILAAIDVVAGYVIAVRVARRDLQIGT